MGQARTSVDDMMAQLNLDHCQVNAILYGRVIFIIQNGRMLSVSYEETKRIGKEIPYPDDMPHHQRPG